jgi:adenylate cyclase
VSRRTVRLNVGAVLDGSVRKTVDHVRVSAQLVDAKTGFNLWAAKFDREFKDVVAV